MKKFFKFCVHRNQSADGKMRTFETRSGPKRSGSFYETVVENMLENVSNDISSTQYSIRRSTFGNERGIARKKKGELKEETKQEIEQMEGKRPAEVNSPMKVEIKETLQPRYIFSLYFVVMPDAAVWQYGQPCEVIIFEIFLKFLFIRIVKYCYVFLSCNYY